MKYTTKKLNYSNWVLVLSGIVVINYSCTKNFEKYNTNNVSANIDMASAFKHIMMAPVNFSGGGDPNSYQVQQNLGADDYSGYFMSANFPNPSNMSYALNPGWNGEMFKVGYLDMMRYVYIIKNMGVDKQYPALWAVAQIMQVEGMDRVTDFYGPTPYSKAGPVENGQTGSPYDSQQDIYTQFFAQLDTATATLKSFIASGQTLPVNFASMDLIYGGSGNEFQNWLRYANSLRLRLAMRIVRVDATTARAQAEKALDPNNGGVLTDNSQLAQVQIPAGNFNNPLAAITINWVRQTNISASIQCYMTGYKDPRISKYMDKTLDTTKLGKYRGIRIGANVTTAYNVFSTLNYQDGETPSFNLRTPVVLMTTAEVYFLRAEAALRGWDNAGGTAQQLYEQGIQTSFNQWSAGSATVYISDNTSIPDAYVDPLNAQNNAPSPSSTTIKWDDAATDEQKLERIITQKWIANFPEGMEAWSEFRRTGYPKLFTVAVNNSGGTINTDLQIRRIPFASNEYIENAAEVNKALQLLSTPVDNGGTRLWWDPAGKGNF